MSIYLSPLPAQAVSIGRAEDPFKKHWIILVIGFIFTGLWLCLPLMEPSVGSTHIDTSKPALDPNAAQSLDAIDNPTGAAGINLAMDGVKPKSKENTPAEKAAATSEATATGAAPAAASAPAASSANNLAQELKKVGEQSSASGWGEKAQRGFTMPHLSGGGLSGVGSASGGSSASASPGTGFFGGRTAQVTFTSAQSAPSEATAEKPVSGGLAGLSKVATAVNAAAALHSGDGMVSNLSRTFDGAKAQAPGTPGGTGGAKGAYAALDAAPANLKGSDPKLNSKEIKAPPSVDVPEAKPGSNMGQQLAMMAATALIAGMMPAAAGAVMTTMASMYKEQMAANAANDSAKQKQAQLTQGINR
jgi:hypothetical protein